MKALVFGLVLFGAVMDETGHFLRDWWDVKHRVHESIHIDAPAPQLEYVPPQEGQQ